MLVFEQPGGGSDFVEAGRVAQVLAGAEIPVVVLNACQSAQVGAQVEAAVATRLLTEGCASVVAMAYSVYAVAAAEFMTAFYERLFAGDRVTDAVSAGRRQLALNDKRPSMKGKLPLADWMVPVHYTRSEARFPHLRTTRDTGEDVGEKLKLISKRVKVGAQTGQGSELASEEGFVGRDAALYTLDVAARLQHVVVLHGPGGTGKTELAKAFGRWWRDTGGVDDPVWVIWHSFEPGVASFGLDGVINAIGHQVFGDRFTKLDDDDRQAKVEELLSTRKLLLIWDNFESVHDMPDPGRATPPLSKPEQDRMRAFLTRISSSGTSAVVITSRTSESWLGPVLRRIELGGLQGEEATAYAEQLLAPYLAARGRRQTVAFAHLMEWLEGHPSSMCLTLPHLDTTTAQHLLDGLQGITAPPMGSESADGNRRTSLPASIAYSYQHLSPADQQALTIVSLFHSVAHVVVLGLFSEQPQAPERFRGLDAPRWMKMLECAAGLGLLAPLGGGLFRLHPALPAYLAAQWRARVSGAYADERTTAIRALVTATADFGSWLDNQIGSGNAQLAFALLSHQQRMLGAMLGHALDHSQWEDAGQILRPLLTYWGAEGQVEEERSWLDRVRLAIETPHGTPPEIEAPAGALWLLVANAQAANEVESGQLARAEYTCNAILRALHQQPSTPRQRAYTAIAYYYLGRIAERRGRLGEAEDWCRKSLTIDEGLENRDGMADTYLLLGVIAQDRRRLDEAEDWYREFLTVAEGVGARPRIAIACHQLGRVTQLRGRLDEAEDWYRKSLTLTKALKNRPQTAGNYHQFGMIAEERGRLEEAEEWYRKSLTINEDLENRPHLAMSYYQLGIIAQERGRVEEAEEWYRKSLAISEDLDDHPGTAGTYHQLGMIVQERGRLEEAEEWYRKSLAISEDLDDRLAMAGTYHQLGMIVQEQGRLEEAEEWYRKSLTITEDLGNRPVMASTYRQLGLHAEEQGDTARALTWVIRCVALFDEVPHPSTGPGPDHLRRLTAHVGIEAVERAWQATTSSPLPPDVRTYVFTEPATE
jgi:tetratricopeptide (TPR) repeat protein